VAATEPLFVTPEEIARALGVSTETVRRDLRKGRVPGAVQAGRAWVIPIHAAERYTEAFVPHAHRDKS
jgi:excisionase family DNA binding protein